MIRLAITLCLFFLSLTTFAKDYSKLYARVDPSVVVITTNETNTKRSKQGITSTTTHGLGSGVIISETGKILTASHVIHDANEILVELADGTVLQARVLTSIVTADIALIQIIDPPDNLTVAKLGDSDKTLIGEEVFVVGAPYGLVHTLTTGNLSGRRKSEDDLLFKELEFLQTDAAINQGNSGGPLFNSKGEVIGIVSFIQSQSGGNEGLGFAASINMAKKLIIDQPGYWWGMRYIPLGQESLLILNVPDFLEGLLVQHVAQGSLADRLGITAGIVPITLSGTEILIGGDIIVQMGGESIYQTRNGMLRVMNYLTNLQSGEAIEVTVFRAGRLKTLSAIKP